MKPFYKRVQVRYGIVSLLLALLIALLFLLPRNPGAYRAVPEHVSLLIEFNNAVKAGKQTAALTDPAWGKVMKSAIFNRCWSDIAVMERLFNDHPQIRRSFGLNRLLAAFTLNPADSLLPLYILETSGGPSVKDWLEAGDIRYFPYQFHGHTLYTIHLSKTERLVIAQKDQHLLCSRFSYLVEDGISQLERPRGWWTNRKLLRELAADAPLRCFFRPKQWLVQYNGVLHPAGRAGIQAIASNIEWLGLGWDGQKPVIGCEANGFLSELGKWNGAPAGQILKVLPNHTAAVLWGGFDNRRLFFDRLHTSGHTDFDHFVLPWVAREAALVVTEPLSPALKDDRLIILGVSDEKKAISSLQAYSESRGGIAREQLGMFELFGFQNGSLLAPFFPEGGQAFLSPYCAILGQYAVFAPNRPALELFLEKYISNQTLEQSPELLHMASDWDQPLRGLVLFNGGYLPGLLQQCFGSKAPPGQTEAEMVSAVGWLGFQMNPTATRLLSMEAAAQKSSSPLPPTDIYWKAPLAAPVVAGVFAVEQPGIEQGVRLLAQDQRTELYCFQPDGSESWRKRIGEKLLSKVVGVDYFESGRLCYLFNTPSYLWLLDENGQDVQGFPIKLNSPAVAGVSMIDFDKNRRPSYLIPCANGHIYGFDWNGRALQGWNPSIQAGVCPFPVAHFQFQGKDYLGALNSEGKLMIFNREGTPRFDPITLHGKIHSPLGVDKAGGKPYFISVNEAGVVFTCGPEGKLTTQTMAGKWNHQAPLKFAVHPAGIALVQGNQLTLLKREKQVFKVLVSKQLPEQASDVFWVGSHIGLQVAGNRKIRLFDSNGNALKGFPLAGSSDFVNIVVNQNPMLVTGNGSAVFAYKIFTNKD